MASGAASIFAGFASISSLAVVVDSVGAAPLFDSNRRR